ncbi:MAG: hypothetical protein RRY34_08940, partial [Victivallaceae bacterium]
NLSTLPILGGIEILRRLFGDSDISSERTEMVVLITGHIVTDNSQLEELLVRYQESVDTLVEFNLPKAERDALKKQQQQRGLVETWFIE